MKAPILCTFASGSKNKPQPERSTQARHQNLTSWVTLNVATPNLRSRKSNHSDTKISKLSPKSHSSLYVPNRQPQRSSVAGKVQGICNHLSFKVQGLWLGFRVKGFRVCGLVYRFGLWESLGGLFMRWPGRAVILKPAPDRFDRGQCRRIIVSSSTSNRSSSANIVVRAWVYN